MFYHNAIMSQEWDIKVCSHVCAVSGEPFADGQIIYSRLDFGQEGYIRRDFSQGAWDEKAKDGALSCWKSTYKAPPPPAQEAVKKETAETLLRQFMAKDDYSKKNVIYILAVMLERKRILIERDVQIRQDGTKLRMYEHRETREMFTIPDPELRLDELQTVQQEVIELLGVVPKAAPSEITAMPQSNPPLET